MRARVRKVLEDIGGEPNRLAQFHFASALRALCDEDCRDELAEFADEFAREQGPVSRLVRSSNPYMYTACVCPARDVHVYTSCV